MAREETTTFMPTCWLILDENVAIVNFRVGFNSIATASCEYT